MQPMEQGRDGVLVEVADHDQVLVGPARDGESWAAAAQRLVGDGHTRRCRSTSPVRRSGSSSIATYG